MKSINSLDFGKNDANGYVSQSDEDFFNKLFVEDKHLEKLLEDSTYFLIGDKGTGKTAYAKYISQNNHWDSSGKLVQMENTDYQRFVKLKNDGKISISDYSDVWIIILLLLISEKIVSTEKRSVFEFLKFRQINNAIDEFYYNAFQPEIKYAIEFVEQSSVGAKAVFESLNAGAEDNFECKFTEERIRQNILYIKRQFEEAISSITLKNNYIVFIDGIDVRPADIEYKEYLACARGLVNAIWKINTGFLGTLHKKGTKIKTCVLIRPDILDAVKPHNLNSKVRDNGLLLDWRTKYDNYSESMIFHMADRILSSQQEKDDYPVGECWNYYFNFKLPKFPRDTDPDNSFIEFLRYSFYRPRDMISLMNAMKVSYKDNKKHTKHDTFNEHDFYKARSEYSNYLLGEIQDYLSFYYQEEDFDLFIKFFQILKPFIVTKHRSFTYDNYLDAFVQFRTYVKKNEIKHPVIFNTADVFLQFLYELNLICFLVVIPQRKRAIQKWCFRERTFTNIRPKVESERIYKIHFGIGRALNLF